MDGVLETGLQLKEPQLRTTKLFARSGYGSLHTGYFLSLTILPVPIERRSFSGSSPFFSHIAATRHVWRHCLCGIAPFVDVALRVVARTILCVTQELTFAPGYTRHGLLVSTASCILLQVLERMVAGWCTLFDRLRALIFPIDILVSITVHHFIPEVLRSIVLTCLGSSS